MGREIRRVVLDFKWPQNKVWEGFVNPLYKARTCEECNGEGTSPEAAFLLNIWYGRVPFKPEDNGSTPFLTSHPYVQRFARGQIERASHYYGTGELAVEREARRMCEIWNRSWSHHLNEFDVKALLDADRLWDFTRRPRNEEQKNLPMFENGWLKESNGYVPTPQEVNEWSLGFLGHDSSNAWIVVKARLKRESESNVEGIVKSIPYQCSECGGEGSIWDSEADKAAYEAWKPTDPPAGEGWQFWETVSEGSPQSPVFATADELVQFLVTHEGYSHNAASSFINVGWVPSGIIQDGVMYNTVEAAVLLDD